MSASVRVRFAPSPTGFFHIGSARTALFNWLYARHTGGTFVLRIEDTDRERNTDAALRVLFDGMRWLGLDWDEGPEMGGDYGPYFQSQRDDVYREYLQILRDKGRAYDQDGAVFFRISGQPQVIEDQIRGRVERTEEKDFVIFRSDGSPVFHFVNVVDDITMRITHVIRGEDHLSNTSKHTELYKAFGAPEPVFAHIPLILKQEGQGKMSKRDRGALIEEYQEKGFCRLRSGIFCVCWGGIRRMGVKSCRSRRSSRSSISRGFSGGTRSLTRRRWPTLIRSISVGFRSEVSHGLPARFLRRRGFRWKAAVKITCRR